MNEASEDGCGVRVEVRTKEFRVIVGPQAGAEFGLCTLARRPGRFDAFIVEEKAPRNLKLVLRYDENSEDFIPSPRPKEGLKELFYEYRIPEDQEVTEVADITMHYAELSDRYGYSVDVPELTLVINSVELKQKGSIEPAREMLDYLIGVYPRSVDGYWQLANLCRGQGETEFAIKCYEKCLEIMPEMRPAREWLDRLETEQ